MISVAVGGRYVTAKNTYNGYIKNIKINPIYAGNPTGALISAPAFFTSIGQPAYAAMTADREVDVEQTGSGFTPILSVNVAPSEKLNIAVDMNSRQTLNLQQKLMTTKAAVFLLTVQKLLLICQHCLLLELNSNQWNKLKCCRYFQYLFRSEC